MIFFGTGSLLKNAISYSLKKGYAIDYVISNEKELLGFCNTNHIRFKQTTNINFEKELLSKFSSDKIVFSINNGQLFNTDVLSLEDFKFYNIHNGLIPKYRGLPEVCIVFALLNNEKEYGVSLHEIDSGIDTGKCLEQKIFPIKETDTFQEVMLKGVNYCQKLFEENLELLIQGGLKEKPVDKTFSKLYTYKDLDNLSMHKGKDNFLKATKLGVFQLYFPKAHSIIKTKLKQINV